jgi:signal transduction histidine kinase/CheY-like chemotaxis protein/putative methionine-R-sulfoxide reductase with GAF domain
VSSFNKRQWGVLEAIAGGAPLADVLSQIVRLVEDQSSGMICSVLLFDAARGTLHTGAAPNLPAGYCVAIEGAAIGPRAGSCGTAAYRREAVVVEDIETHPYWADYRVLAAQYRLRACWSTPIFSATQDLLGTFAMYHREPHTPTEVEREWVSTATHLAAIAIVKERSERQTRLSEGRFRLLHELNEAMRAAIDPDRLLPAALRLLGQHLRVSRCVYAIVDADGDRCTVPPDYTDNCASSAGDYRLSDFGPSIYAAFLRGDRAVVVNDIATDLDPLDDPQRFLAIEVRAFVCCSLVREGQLRAMMAIHSNVPRTWTEGEVAIVQDFVERCWATVQQRGAEARLRESEALLRIAGQAAKLGGFRLEVPGLRLTWSDEVRRIHEVAPAFEPEHDAAIAFYAEPYRQSIRQKFTACIEQGTPFDFEAPLVSAQGRTVWVRVVGHAERNDVGAICRVLGAFQSIEDRRRLEEQLRQSQKMEAVGQLAGGIAHDFNNLLSVILSYTTIVGRELPAGDPLVFDMQQISQAAVRASELTAQLLVFSRKQVLQPRVVDLNQVVAGLESMLHRVVGEATSLQWLPHSGPCKALVDPGQVEQVLLNLAVNARDAMPKGGLLTLETRVVELSTQDVAGHPGVAPGQYVLLRVSDTGVGMDAATRARIFEPFFTTKERGKGTGLGLSMVWGIIAQSGGSIWVESEPGRGTTFKLYVPSVDGAVELVSSRPMSVAPQQGNETILLVEDDEQVRTLVKSVLRRNGYNVLDARNGGEALLLCEQHEGRVHLLLTDVVMQRMTGRELAERLAQVRADLKVLYVSGYAENSIVDHGVLAAGISFLSKPITPDALLDKVRQVLDAGPRVGP